MAKIILTFYMYLEQSSKNKNGLTSITLFDYFNMYTAAI